MPYEDDIMMKKSVLLVVMIGILLFSGYASLFADVRIEPVALFLVLDKSLSMVEEIDAVKDYVNRRFIDDFLIPGDYLLIIQFFGQAGMLVSSEITSPNDKDRIKGILSGIEADGRFTDIGNALDTLADHVEKFSDDPRRTYLILITDGIQEAPHDSPYYAPDGQFNHAFLEHTKTIQQKGWKIQILGIGSETAAEEIARELSGGYVEIPLSSDSQEYSELTGEIFGFVEARNLTMSPIREDGSAELKFTLEPKDYDNPITIIVSGITATTPGGEPVSLLSAPVSIPLEPGTVHEQSVLVNFPVSRDLFPEGTEVQCVFTFSGQEVFAPAVFTLSVTHTGFLAERLWMLPVVLICLAALIILVVLIRRKKPREVLQFSCIIEDGPPVTRKMKLKGDQEAYICQGISGFTLSSSKSGSPCGVLKAQGGLLKLQVVDEDAFRIIGLPPVNILGETLRVRKSDGTYALLTFAPMTLPGK